MLQSFSPIVSVNTRILILGSMPGKASLDANQYYAHPRNLLWSLLAMYAEEQSAPPEYSLKLAMLERIGVGLWDVLQHCEREGSLDSDIKPDTEQANDFASLFKTLPNLQRICFNGKKAEHSFYKHVVKAGTDVSAYSLHALPSTSPANASIPLAVKQQQWFSALNI